MMRIKSFFSIITAAAAALTLLAGCGDKSSKTNEGKLSVVTTIFPEYDWVRNIAGDKADITMLLDNGVDLHSYQPSVADIANISSCDVFIYTGGESDNWVEDALKEATNKDMQVINLMEVLGDKAKEEEVKEGMEAEEKEEEEEETEYDEHIWLSFDNALTLSEKITDTLCSADSDNAGTYKSNLKAYSEKLTGLKNDYTATVEAAKYKTLIFGDRFPFRYLTDEFGLDYYAAFAGCSAETEASFETVRFLAKKMDELSLPVIITIENSDRKIASTILENTASPQREILTLDSMQSVTSEDVKNGKTYLDIMKSNLEVLKQAVQ